MPFFFHQLYVFYHLPQAEPVYCRNQERVSRLARNLLAPLVRVGAASEPVASKGTQEIQAANVGPG